jgi:hypothetical protein
VWDRLFLVSRGELRLSPLGTSATNWPIIPARMIYDECEAVGGMRIGRGKRSTGKKLLQCHLVHHDLTWARNRSIAVGSRRLIAWAMALPNGVGVTKEDKLLCDRYVQRGQIL